MSEHNPLLEDLNLSAPALGALQAHGYFTLDDLRPLTTVQIVRLPNVGGKSLRRILAALGRELTRSS
jgi:DNA-directed RNA polymerase alpha subunit